MSADLVRITVNLTPKAQAALDRCMAATGASKTDTINQALPAYDLLLALVERCDGRLSVNYADGTRGEVHFL